MFTRILTNSGQVVGTPDGAPLVGKEVTFTLVRVNNKKKVSLFDVVSGDYIKSIDKTILLSVEGEFSTPLWPNDRGEFDTLYKVSVDGEKPFFIKVNSPEAGEEDVPLSLINAKLLVAPAEEFEQSVVSALINSVQTIIAAGVTVVTTTANGLMSYADKIKLDGIAANANNYTHPASHSPSVITQDANNRFVTDAEKAGWSSKEPSITAGLASQYFSGNKTWVTLDAAAVGLGNVTNESKSTMFSSPTFTGNATSPIFTSTIVTGTAPFTVASTTKVTNLNADQLDGFHASQSPSAGQIVVVGADSNTTLPKGLKLNNQADAGSTVLDWFEKKGTWTPVVGQGVVTGQAFSTRDGKYTRIGNQVTCTFDLVMTAKGSPDGGNLIVIQGLPYGAGASNGGGGGFICRFANLGSSWVALNIYVPAGTSVAYVIGLPVAGTGTTYPAFSTDLTNTTQLTGTFTYFV